MRLLVTRPQGDGEDTAARLRARGHAVLLMPLLCIEPVPDADLGDGPYTAVLMTSGNAARAIATHPRGAELLGLPVFTVGARTAEAARGAGFRSVISADGNVEDLVRLVASRLAGSDQPVLYLAGEDRAGDLAGALAAHALAVHTAVVYRAVTATRFSPQVAAALAGRQIDGILHYSRRSADAFVACARADGLLDQCLDITHYCLSARVAQSLLEQGAKQVSVSLAPDEASLFALLEKA